MIAFLTGALTGIGFGIVLYKVGATRYSRVMGMLTLRDTKVMKFAFTAIGTAAILYGLAAAFGVAEEWNLVPRVMPYLGWAHVVGGILFGAAMGVSGLCPGTCVAKTGGRGGEKRFAGLVAMLGLVAGVLVYAAVKDRLTDAGIIATNPKPLTVHGVLGLPYAAVALVWGAAFVGIAIAIDRLTVEKSYEPEHERKSLLDYVRGEWSWVASGTIGGVLVVLATRQGGYLGFSGAVLAFVGWLSHLVGHPLEVVPRITDDIIWRAALIMGVLPGAFLAKLTSLSSRAAVEQPLPKQFDAAALGKTFGAVTTMTLGAMIGGGCTTGAFIAAWPTLSVGSLAMAGTFFAASMATANLRLMVTRSLDLSTSQAIGDRVYD